LLASIGCYGLCLVFVFTCICCVFQADLWKQDFDAERSARERQVQEKNSIIHDMKNLETKNQQLIDELESYSRKSLAEMQHRHASPTYQQQLQSQLQGGAAYQGGPAVQYPHQGGAAHQHGHHNQGQPIYPPNNYQPGQQMGHGGMDEAGLVPANPPQVKSKQQYVVGSQEERLI